MENRLTEATKSDDKKNAEVTQRILLEERKRWQFQRIKKLEINTNEKFHLRETLKTLEELTEVLGLKKEEIIIENKVNEDQILSLINKRLIAKKEKDYAEADKIRNSLKEKGVELIDQSPELTTWVRI